MSRAYCTFPLTPDPSPRKRGEGGRTASPLPGGERGRGEGTAEGCCPWSRPATNTTGTQASGKVCRLMAGVRLRKEGSGGRRALYHRRKRGARGFTAARWLLFLRRSLQGL